jgi:hypothetical protein
MKDPNHVCAGLCPTLRQELKRHMSPRGVSSIVITVFKNLLMLIMMIIIIVVVILNFTFQIKSMVVFQY